jgi:hypothetical protein
MATLAAPDAQKGTMKLTSTFGIALAVGAIAGWWAHTPVATDAVGGAAPSFWGSGRIV